MHAILINSSCPFILACMHLLKWVSLLHEQTSFRKAHSTNNQKVESEGMVSPFQRNRGCRSGEKGSFIDRSLQGDDEVGS